MSFLIKQIVNKEHDKETLLKEIKMKKQTLILSRFALSILIFHQQFP